jgi:hypothetical protein
MLIDVLDEVYTGIRHYLTEFVHIDFFSRVQGIETHEHN